mmetsp:Transcript_9169/g.17935  ORF Transcript_9169/g.17935 Transcript_9169/m.17935 type:complete len:226 (-) Transcript_9169:1325-2002(-)
MLTYTCCLSCSSPLLPAPFLLLPPGRRRFWRQTLLLFGVWLRAFVERGGEISANGTSLRPTHLVPVAPFATAAPVVASLPFGQPALWVRRFVRVVVLRQSRLALALLFLRFFAIEVRQTLYGLSVQAFVIESRKLLGIFLCKLDVEMRRARHDATEVFDFSRGLRHCFERFRRLLMFPQLRFQIGTGGLEVGDHLFVALALPKRNCVVQALRSLLDASLLSQEAD